MLGVSADFLLEGNEAFSSDEEKKRMLNENIMGSLSVCSVKTAEPLWERMARLYVEGIVDRD